MSKRAAQLDREIAEALTRKPRAREATSHATARSAHSGGRSFLQLFATWLKDLHGDELRLLLQELMTDAVENSTRKPARDKLIKKVSALITERAVNRFTRSPEFVRWLDGVMERVGNETNIGYESLGFNRADLDSEEPFTVSARYVGDPQDADTEVPAHLSHTGVYGLIHVLERMGAKASCGWNIREIDAGYGGYGSRELRTVYDCRLPRDLSDERAAGQAVRAARA